MKKGSEIRVRIFHRTAQAFNRYSRLETASGSNVITAALISRQITELESFFEVPLREKHGKSVKLSKEGEELAIMTSAFLSSLEDFQDKLDGIAPKIIVGAGQTFFDQYYPPLL